MEEIATIRRGMCTHDEPINHGPSGNDDIRDIVRSPSFAWCVLIFNLSSRDIDKIKNFSVKIIIEFDNGIKNNLSDFPFYMNYHDDNNSLRYLVILQFISIQFDVNFEKAISAISYRIHFDIIKTLSGYASSYIFTRHLRSRTFHLVAASRTSRNNHRPERVTSARISSPQLWIFFPRLYS